MGLKIIMVAINTKKMNVLLGKKNMAKFRLHKNV